jgi:hypothetical protein
LGAFGVDTSLRDVGFVNKYMIDANEQNFEVTLTANFTVLSYTFSTDDKMLQFNVDAIHEKENVAEIIIPRDLFDGEFTVLLDDKEISSTANQTERSSVISVVFDGKGDYTISITATNYLGTELEKSNNGGCLIATASFGSELAPQVQLLREIRDNTILQTKSGSAFMTGFNQLYYSFSPTIADYERENLIFKEAVKLILTPLLISLTLLQYVDIDSEHEMLGYGIAIILLNIGMYFVAPAVLITKIRKRVNIEKLHKIHG